MNDENLFGNGLPEETNYTETAQHHGAPQGVSAPVLDDIDYVEPSSKKDGPQGVSAPVLDDMDVYVPNNSKKGAPQGVSAPVLDDDNYTAGHSKKDGPQGVTAPILDDPDDYQPKETPKQLVLSDEDIISGLTDYLRVRFEALPADKQKQIIEMRRSQLGAVDPPPPVSAPIIDEDNYTPPPKKEEPAQPETPISAPILDDAPETPVYKPKFVDEDLERAKQEAAKKAVSSQLVSEQKDSKESLRMMLELKEERRAELAKKGFRISIIVAVIGIIAAVAFYLLYSGQLGLTYKSGLSGAAKILENSSLYISVIAGVLSLTLITGIGGLKSLTSVFYLILGIIQVFPGIVMISQHNGSMGLVGALYGISLACTIAVFVTLSASEALGEFYKKPKKQYD